MAVGLPAGYFALGYSALGSSLQTKADFKGETVTQLISSSPEMWRFEEHRLNELLVRLPVELLNEHAKLISSDGDLVAESAHVLNQPVLMRSAEVFDSGHLAGRVELRSSLWPLLKETGLVALIGSALAALLQTFLRRQEYREGEMTKLIFEEKERARVTLRSITDAVITTDIGGRVDYLNPTAERLTQFGMAEAIGKPLSDIVRLIDENSMQPLTAPVPWVLNDQRKSLLGDSVVALIRPDFSSLAIEGMSAPLLNGIDAMVGDVIVFRDVTGTRKLTQRISWDASHDTLTGLVNRREIEDRVDAAILSAKNSKGQHAFCYLDLDQFKVINDTCGHLAGDTLLKQLSDSLCTRLRDSDTLARLGGDEFGALLEGCPLDRAQSIAADLLVAVNDFRFNWEDKVFSIGVSIGVVSISGAVTRAEVFAAADTACYAAKEQGRNRVCTFKSNDVEMARRHSDMNWSARLVSALEEERFVLYYQSYLALKPQNEAHQHIEILLRLIDENGNLVMPGHFIPAAERYNLMPDIDRWVIRNVISRYHDLLILMGSPLTCAINLSGTTLNSEGILGFIKACIVKCQSPVNAFCFEITETAAINNLHQAKDLMRDLKAHGVLFALDDFGIGTNSLSHLRNLPFDFLKIDGSFVKNMMKNPVDYAMADSVNRLGHIMGIKTVGEYAESPEVIDALRAIGVDFAQGYGFHSPEALPSNPSCQS
jgi:diguanylate cyclase (GGDEF)-like protein